MKIINDIVCQLVIYITRFITWIFFPMKMHGKENLDIDEAYILYINHISLVDSVIIGSRVLRRKSYFMGKEELFHGKFMKWIFTAIGGFPVKRGTPDMVAIKKSVEYLKGGGLLALFPEGTRNTNEDKSLMKFHNGLGIIALKAKCKIIPCYIDSAYGYKLFRKFDMYIGEPIDLKEFEEKGIKKENLNNLMELSRNKMIELIPKY